MEPRWWFRGKLYYADELWYEYLDDMERCKEKIDFEEWMDSECKLQSR